MALPAGVVPPSQFCPNCQGLDFHDQDGDNEALLTSIVKQTPGGFLCLLGAMGNGERLDGEPQPGPKAITSTLPSSYISPNFIYAISITPSGSASLVTYDSHITPPATYPVLSPPLASAQCTAQDAFQRHRDRRPGWRSNSSGINTNETLYIIRHADAHPTAYWDDNNYVGAGQWRALDLPNALARQSRQCSAGVFERSRVNLAQARSAPRGTPPGRRLRRR